MPVFVNFENLSTFEVASISIVAPDTHIVDIEWYEWYLIVV